MRPTCVLRFSDRRSTEGWNVDVVDTIGSGDAFRAQRDLRLGVAVEAVVSVDLPRRVGDGVQPAADIRRLVERLRLDDQRVHDRAARAGIRRKREIGDPVLVTAGEVAARRPEEPLPVKPALKRLEKSPFLKAGTGSVAKPDWL